VPALETVHGHGVIRRTSTRRTWSGTPNGACLQLIDFGIASELPQQIEGIVNPALWKARCATWRRTDSDA
jgi:hypothetical protein